MAVAGMIDWCKYILTEPANNPNFIDFSWWIIMEIFVLSIFTYYLRRQKKIIIWKITFWITFLLILIIAIYWYYSSNSGCFQYERYPCYLNFITSRTCINYPFLISCFLIVTNLFILLIFPYWKNKTVLYGLLSLWIIFLSLLFTIIPTIREVIFTEYL